MSSTAVRTSHVAERIIDFLEMRAVRPMYLAEIVRTLGIDKGNCSKLLKSLAENGKIALVEGYNSPHYWRIAEPSNRSVEPSNQSAWSEALQSVDSSLKSIARTLESAFSAWTEAGDAVGSLISPAPTAP
ncbi:MAG: hypothetical protein FWG73_09595, partial [Planctomycetaceae bacterium]|nr:hypothetical protein [Planctomycetaceae bacterium]